MNNNMEIGVKLKKINNILEKKANRNLEALDITHSQLHILMYLLANRKKEVCQKEIEEQFKLKNPTVTGILNRLEEKEFISRSVSIQDGRYRKIDITQKTIDLQKNMKNKLVNINKKITYGMNENQVEQLDNLLGIVLKNLLDN